MRQSGFGIASLVLGILSLVFICFYGQIFAIPGIIFGIIGMAQKKKSRGTAIAGFICSLIAFITYIILVMILQETTNFLNELTATTNQITTIIQLI